ncbi:TetR/AcrR family transcriptional regulator [Halobacillus sp. BBL2006]|uniref:TetR/AcrR family transcriptional regulator n=1 Tax=Halobacillus sp. BBL2006 TaxID=1543706 RepID=UPI0005434FEB|nr:TetR/AcrR family transcriptional regulator [Halobacillus sp. BBL2006]KHE72481.1 TetR family transcriptional regulator [Halobacillus sp. BBL2006]
MSPKVSREHLRKRRAKILEAAKQVFIQQGYERTTMKHVMDAAEVSRGGLYQYFSNKEDLYEAILEGDLSKAVSETDESLEMEVVSHWKLLKQKIFGENGEPDDEMDPMAPSNLEFFITGRNDHRRREYGQKRYKLGLKLYANVIEAGQRSGEFSQKYDSGLIARSIISYIDGLSLDGAILPKEEIQLKEQSTLLLDYLKAVLEVEEE